MNANQVQIQDLRIDAEMVKNAVPFRRLEPRFLSTGLPGLDEILHGGLYSAQLTELAGVPCSGKTQVALWTSLISLLDNNHHVVYIDTNASFSRQRCIQLLKTTHRSNLELDHALKRLLVVECLDLASLIAFLATLLTSASKDPPILLVLDSISSILSPLIGKGLRQGYDALIQIGTLLKQIARTWLIPILVVNGAVADSNGLYKPALGSYWETVPTTTVLFTIPEDDARSLMWSLISADDPISYRRIEARLSALDPTMVTSEYRIFKSNKASNYLNDTRTLKIGIGLESG